MFRLKSTLIIGLLSLLSLTACGETNTAVNDLTDKAKETTEQAKNTVEDAKNTAADSATSATGLLALKESVTSMKTGVTSTLDAAKTGDFETAKTEFSKVQDSWPALKDKINPDSAQPIQEGIDTLKADLGAGTPDKTKIVEGLQNLVKSITSIKLG